MYHMADLVLLGISIFSLFAFIIILLVLEFQKTVKVINDNKDAEIVGKKNKYNSGGKYIQTLKEAYEVIGRENIITVDDVASFAGGKIFSQTNKLEFSISEKLLEEDQYLLYYVPKGINVEMLMKNFSGFICFDNHPEKYAETNPEVFQKELTEGWYLTPKNNLEARFTYKDRKRQVEAMKSWEAWGSAADALYLALIYRVIWERDYLTEYTLCCDKLYVDRGEWTTAVRNFLYREDLNRGNLEITCDTEYHSHRNVVPFVKIDVTA